MARQDQVEEKYGWDHYPPALDDYFERRNTYTVKVRCENCGYEKEMHTRKGKERPKTMMCRHCRCMSEFSMLSM